MASGSQFTRNASTIGFAAFITFGLLAIVATVVGYALALGHNGTLGSAWIAPWIALMSLAAAAAIAPRVPPSDPGSARSTTIAMATGIAAASIVTGMGVLARDVGDLESIGPLQIGVAALAILTLVGSPLIARCMMRLHLVEHAASLTGRTASAPPDASPTERSIGRWGFVAFIVGISALIAGLAYVLSAGPLGHDESVYAVQARSWYEGTPSTGFGIYRPLGLPAIAWIVLHFSDSEVAFRFAGTALAVGAIGIMWITGRTMLGPIAAWIGTGVFVGSASFLRRATEFLNDLTAAGLLLGAMFVIWYHFERRPGAWWLLAASPLAAAAYYVRYGSALGLVVIAIVAGIVWFRELPASWRQIAATALALSALLVPHFLYSIDETGSPLGVFRVARTSVGGGGGGLSDYLRWFPERLVGALGALVIFVGVVYLVVLLVFAVRRRRWPPETRTVVFLTATALLLTIALGAFTHGEPRFVFLPLMALLLVGGRSIAVALGHVETTPRRLATVAMALALTGGFAIGVVKMGPAMDGITGRREVIAQVAEAVRHDVGQGPCSIRSTYIPQLTWYSECSTVGFTGKFPADGAPGYLAIFENGKRQPTGADLEAEIAATSGSPIIVVLDPHDRVGDGSVYQYEPGS